MNERKLVDGRQAGRRVRLPALIQQFRWLRQKPVDGRRLTLFLRTERKAQKKGVPVYRLPAFICIYIFLYILITYIK